MPLLAGIYDKASLNSTEIPQDILNIESKSRSNPLPWNGQFSPQLVQALLKKYSSPSTVLLDPFVGSGTVLLESGLMGRKAFGTEINPAAVILSRLYYLINIPIQARQNYVKHISFLLNNCFSNIQPLFTVQSLDESGIQKSLINLLAKVEDHHQRHLLEALIVLLDFYNYKLTVERVFSVWKKLSATIMNFPFSPRSIEVFNSDARKIPLPNNSIDLVVTSPPYINVFNYHQNYRASTESLSWNLLSVAKSEFGSNRKHRSNRFFTVIQYMLDIAQTFQELHRLVNNNARLIFIVGRESMVCKTPFYNGEIVTEIAHKALGYEFLMRQERMFINRFGQKIYEDILHFSPPAHSIPQDYLDITKDIGVKYLKSAEKYTPEKYKPLIHAAYASSQKINPSPIFDVTAAKRA
ncbi:MAG TPA: DNA methyltransferase [Anaerolineales bacterium]|nr:DNA methyltransferase [Anaerolineales bacterium]